MADSDPRSQVDGLLKQLRGTHLEKDPQVPFEADRRHLVTMVENVRLMQSEVGDYRQLKTLRHYRRMATLAEWPTVRDFEENREAEAAGIEDGIESLLEAKACSASASSTSRCGPRVSRTCSSRPRWWLGC